MNPINDLKNDENFKKFYSLVSTVHKRDETYYFGYYFSEIYDGEIWFNEKLNYHKMKEHYGKVVCDFDENEVKKYIMSIEKNDNVMTNLGGFFHYVYDYEEIKKYYLLAIEQNNLDAMYELGTYYDTDDNQSKKYFKMAVDIGNHVYSMYELGCIYSPVDKFTEIIKKTSKYEFHSMVITAEKYFLMAIEHSDHPYAAQCLAKLYEQIETQYEIKSKKLHHKIVDYYMSSINQGCYIMISDLADYYEKNKKYDDVIKCYMIGVEKNHRQSMMNMAEFYEKRMKYCCREEEKEHADNAIKYLKMLMNNNKYDGQLIAKIGHIYELARDYDNMKKYYLMAISEYENEIAMTYLKKFYSGEPLKLRDVLLRENENKLIIDNIFELNTRRDVRIYENKVASFKRLNNYRNCESCSTNNILHINLYCGHETCIECYKDIMNRHSENHSICRQCGHNMYE